MSRRYLEDIGVELTNIPENWCPPDDERTPQWEMQREMYGFDERDTWSLDYTIALLFYERLRMYNDVNIIDTSSRKFDYKGETLSMQDCIDRMLEGLEVRLNDDDFSYSIEKYNKVTEVYEILALCHGSLWW